MKEREGENKKKRRKEKKRLEKKSSGREQNSISNKAPTVERWSSKQVRSLTST